MPRDVKKTWDACGEAFDRYTSSKNSFSELIERPSLEKLLREIAGLRLLDLGCGSGIYALSFAARGAHVTGLDISETMIDLARRKARERDLSAEFHLADIGNPLPFPESEFDLVFTSTALHYLADLQPTMIESARVLKPGGRLVASVLHPISTSRFPLASERDGAEVPSWDSRSNWPINYLGERNRTVETPWLNFGEVASSGRRLRCFHHVLSDYFGAMKSAGLSLTDLLEPGPPLALASSDAARYEESISVPVYLIFSAVKPL